MKVHLEYSREGTHSYDGLKISSSEDIAALVRKVKGVLDDSATADEISDNFDTLGLAGFSEDYLNEIINLNPADSYYTPWRTGEALAEILLTENYNCWIPFSKQSDTTNLATSQTGVDLLGIASNDNGNILLLFAEVKTSSEATRPPRIVHGSGRDCLTAQLKDVINSRQKQAICIRYLAARFKQQHPRIDEFVAAVKSHQQGKFAVYGVVVRDTAPHKDDLEATSNSIANDTACQSHPTSLFALHVSSLEQLTTMVKSA